MPEQFPRTLFLDIETFSIVGNTWGMWQQNVIKVQRWSSLCAFSAKWEGGSQVTRALPDYRGYTPYSVDDRELVMELWGLLNEADIVSGHNVDEFDIKKVNARFVKHGLPPPAPYKTVDTKKVAKRHFKFDSNSLNNLCDFLGIGRKLKHTGFDMWEDCLAGDVKAWAMMKKYNAHDVVLQREVYLALRPWMDNHPNMNLWRPGACPKCGANKLQSRGIARTLTREYKRFQCTACGGWSRGTQTTGKILVTNHG